ncbi:MAG: Rrf2 family transcriptional regulator [Gemmatales bacterium]|nr:Rrf2 family transcriptional regulator [Gemmatales bacterium]MCS7161384.1 Rrf2 family transcriptional regulator [Gemmatales bacterium]MDW8176587.1 Rrf2 family transcriptional regulator [Gemmatales bacterium]MDW8223805.1 Rrf2 family transcriptional regulator [Gemmatales bacterium]
MRITRATTYAIYAMVDIAQHKAEGARASHVIAENYDIPERFLLKVLKPLVAAGLLHSVKGPRGGYQLARPATQITLLEIIEAVEGPLRGQQVFLGRAQDPVEKKLAQAFQAAAEELCRKLNQVKLSHFL